ncbi:MAG: recombinase [Betaproteobacteria bacterium]|nr:recombinase [Betaproteobacteria bacterium]
MSHNPLRWIARWRESADPHVGLDALLVRADPAAGLEDRLAWLHDLSAWLRAGLPDPGEAPRENAPQTVRLKHLLNVLERNPALKARFAAALRQTVDAREAFDLLIEAGMPRETGFLGEFANRLFAKVLPQPPATDLASLFGVMFPDSGDAALVQEISAENWAGVLSVLDHGEGAAAWRAALAHAAAGAIRSLSVQACAGTLPSAIRRRMQASPDQRLAAWYLPEAARVFADVVENDARGDREAAAAVLHKAIRETLLEVERAYSHLDEQGVSVAIVYQLERVRAQAQRMGELADLLASPEAAPRVLPYFVAGLIRDAHDQRSASALLRQNFELASRKIVERNAETGEHYITRNRVEYRDMLARAGGGGAVMALTTYLKFGVSALHLPLFLEGFLASLNYAATFVAIQFAHLTVATKQPAMTAPALAARMRNLADPARMTAFLDEVGALVRSQSAGIIGNVFVVFPVTYALGMLLVHAAGFAPVDGVKAAKTIDSVSLLGPSALFAAMTGVLLWFSSVLAGWVDNWFAFRRLAPAIAGHRRFVYLFGPSRMQRVAGFLSREIAGLTANISLGFMLGLVPVFFAFFGLPVEVRHVTLSSGQLAASVVALGWGVVLTAPFWMAVAGIAVIGALNVGVSFALALNVAIGARESPGVGRRAIYRAILRRMSEDPKSFLFPRKEPLAG